MLIQEIVLDGNTYQIEIDKIDQDHFWSQNVAVAKAYAKVHDVWYYTLLERLANMPQHDNQTSEDKTLLKLWALSFA